MQADKEKLQRKNKEAIFKMQQLQDKIIDRDDKIDQLNSKLDILTGENNQLRENYDKLMKKLEEISENNILIPKDGKKDHGNQQSEMQK